MTKVINFFGGPGTGKSTLAASLFAHMKKEKHSVELITEFAKDLTWAARHNELRNQCYVFGKQLNRLLNVHGQVDYIVTDSPILLSVIYNQNVIGNSRYFSSVVHDIYTQFENINFLVESDYSFYDPKGRNQTADESASLGNKIKNLLDDLKTDDFAFSKAYKYNAVTRHSPIENIYDKVING